MIIEATISCVRLSAEICFLLMLVTHPHIFLSPFVFYSLFIICGWFCFVFLFCYY